MERLFVYGTLKLPHVQVAVLGRETPGEPDALLGFRREWLAITDAQVLETSGEHTHPILIRDETSEEEIAGLVLDLTEDEIACCDAYEVKEYTRIPVRLKSGKQAWFYAGNE